MRYPVPVEITSAIQKAILLCGPTKATRELCVSWTVVMTALCGGTIQLKHIYMLKDRLEFLGLLPKTEELIK